jgi:hypothetical protein
MEWIAKLIGPIVGKIISYAILIYEAKNLSNQEKSVIRKYSCNPSYPMTKEVGTDDLIKKSIAAMSTNNRAIFTEKGLKIKAILEKFNF